MMTVHNESDFGDYNHDYYLRKYDFAKWDDVDRYGKMMNHIAKRWIVKRGHLNDDYLAIAKSITNV